MTAKPSAEVALCLAVSQRPDAVAPRVELALLLAGGGRRREAVALLREGLLFAATREDRLEQLAEGLLAIDALPEALEALESALRLVPGDRNLRRRLEAVKLALEDSQTVTRQLFNQYAAGFEDHLAALAYVAPQEIERILAPYTARFENGLILDLGCGTGLMGLRLRRHAARLVGIDLSVGMLEEARSKGLYDELIECDIVAHMQTGCTAAGLIVAADVLVYMGDLLPLFAHVAPALAEAGLFAFTAERCEGDGFVLEETRRYRHSECYIRHVAEATGLAVLTCERIVPRRDRGKPVDGLVLLLERVTVPQQ